MVNCDPYYNSDISLGFFGGGLSAGPRQLNRRPYVVEEELNEWESVPPGTYSLRVASRRLGSSS